MDDSDIEVIINGSSRSDDLEILKRACCELMKRFDTVQIFTTRHEPDSDGTINCNKGAGNFFARYGHVKQWILKEESEARE